MKPRVLSQPRSRAEGAIEMSRAQELKNRLIDRGVSPKPLPSIKRPKVKHISLSRIRQQPQPESLMEVIQPKPPPRQSSKTNVSGYFPVGKLRPATASRKRNVEKLPSKASVANFSIDESYRAKNMVHRMSGHKAPVVPSQIFHPSYFTDELPDEKDFKEPSTEVEKFIKVIQESSEEGNFIYCESQGAGHYDLSKISNSLEDKEYYTLSKHGVSKFVGKSAVEFTHLSDWLIEREVYGEMCKISFFSKFRIWKSTVMWKRNVQRLRRKKKSKKLKEKLFWVDEVYSDLLLNHKSQCCEMERNRFLEIPTNPEGLSLDGFLDLQRQRQKDVRKKLKSYALTLRENVNTHIKVIMNVLRENIISQLANDKTYARRTANIAGAGRCTLHEKLGFPDNMSFGQRAKVRGACSRYIRFSYLADFYVLESLTLIYQNSVGELLNRMRDLILAGGKKRKLDNPLFAVQLYLSQKNIPISERRSAPVYEFIPPPEGTSQPNDFCPNVHLYAENMEGDSPIKLHADDIVGNKVLCPTILQNWVHFDPSPEDLVDALLGAVGEGLESTLVIQRWNRHPELEEFKDALEEWDDTVATDWTVADVLELDPKPWLADDPLFIDLEAAFRDLTKRSYEQLQELVSPLHEAVHSLWENSEIEFDVFKKEKLRNQADAFANAFSKFKWQVSTFSKIRNEAATDFIRLSREIVKQATVDSARSCIRFLKAVLPQLLRERTVNLREWVMNSVRKLPMKISTVDDYVTQRNALIEINAVINEKKEKFDTYNELYRLATEQELDIPKEDTEVVTEVRIHLGNLTTNIIFAESNNDKYVVTFKKEVNIIVPEYLQEVAALEIKVLEDKYLKVDTVAAFAIRDLEDLSAKCIELEEQAEKINNYQRFLDLPLNRFEEIELAREELDLRLNLWRALRDWRRMQQEWKGSPFKETNVRFIRDKAEEFSKIVSRSENSLPESSVILELKEMVNSFKETMPVVEAMRSRLEESHWRLIKEIIGKDFEITDTFTLGDLMKFDVVDKQEQIQAVATQAAQELQLKTQLEDIKNIWQELELPVQKYKDNRDSWILGDVEEVLSILDESCAKLSMISGNRYVAVIRDEVNKWKDNLNTMQDIMEEWILFQKGWMYLSNIFNSGDIKRQLSEEYQLFQSVDKFFKNIMKKTSQRSQVLKATVGVNGLLTDLRRYNVTIDQLQKKLNKYLETKRSSFPRFYFLSDDELLDILANSNDIKQVQPHLKKCFDNINSLEISKERNNDIEGMKSMEGETVFFGKTIRIKGNVEDWLRDVQTAMVDTLMHAMPEGSRDLESSKREQWVLRHPGQIVATVSQIAWSAETEAAIEIMQDSPNALDEWYNQNGTQLDALVELVRGSLSDLQRRIIVALITTDVHGRDIIEMLRNEGVESVNDFLWQQQLRYYWEGEIVMVRQINASLAYGYEYMGATTRLVITPLTDRCWITITSALNIKLGASPAGPAGTGKTESTKDLAKGIGMQCVVFNCSEQITYKMMGRLFSGLAQQGAWSCLDEFNRIDIEVLSVIAQQLLTIQNALREGVTEFMFEDSLITLKNTCGVFITMNPGYAGRTELPDNLKVCFRPVAMMIPDYAMIAEIMLFAEGFSDAKPLSKKMVQLYKLASEQLSQQDHYDFGMRAVKSVLVMAGELKRANPSQEENFVLIRAMRDSNIPKFVSHDIPLFEALVKDLFPSVIIVDPPVTDLHRQIGLSVLEKQLQRVKEFEKKVLQLFDTLCVRFGVMLVGPTGSGKSECRCILSHAITQLRLNGAKDTRFQKVDMKVLNPKCISMGELYGEVNPLTQDWRDGLASSVMRAAAADSTNDAKWVVFDGPVDSLWIENMNTVLDDNMMLCLANGERVKLRPQMRILFEVQDLAHASPATVSRCGMVYLSSENIGWKPYVQTWANTKLEGNEETKAHLLRLFEHSMHATLKFRASLQEPIQTVEIQLAGSVCDFLEALLTGENCPKLPEAQDERLKVITAVFAFSLTWGMGGALSTSSRERFSDFVKSLLSGMVDLPIPETIFDYFLVGRKFKHWNEIVGEFTYTPGIPFVSIVVPTIVTTTYEYILNTLVSKNKSVFFTGESGVGKSVIITAFISRLKEDSLIEPALMNFSAQTSSHHTQMTIEEKVERKSKGFYSATGNKKLFVFVDDINMPTVEIYGAQPPIELLRQFVDYHGFYDRQKLYWSTIGNFALVAAAAPPGGGRNALTPRFMRHFNLFSLPEPSMGTLSRIFGSILGGFFDIGFTEAVKKVTEAAVASTIQVYMQIIASLKPSPAKFHYIFNLRDVSKVFQGMLMAHPKSLPDGSAAARLWIHECKRIFGDRMITDSDREWLDRLLLEQIQRYFRLNWSFEEVFVENKILFSDILNLSKAIVTYEQVTDLKKLTKELYNKLDEFNTGNSKKMQLVFFENAIEHVLRIARSLRQPRGNMLLIGVGGSGKRSLSLLCSYILEFRTYEIALSKQYGLNEFREDLRKMMEVAGVEGKDLTFILPDTQIASEAFLEDVNSVLNTGEVTGLFLQEDVDQIVDNLRPELVDRMKLPDSKDLIYSTFVQRVRQRLHIVMCMSPVGETLRVRCRKFPSLVNCATLDWFSEWPEEALLSVSSQFLKQLSCPEEVRTGLSRMCMEIHQSVSSAAERFFLELRRRTYITPKSFLDLIDFYLQQLEASKGRSLKARDRLRGGLNNLKNTRGTVNDLQQDLTRMAPELEVQKKKTADYFLQVQRETKAAEVLRTQVEKEKEVVNHQMLECKAKADEAEEELALAMPALENALRALNALNPRDINEMRQYKQPPPAVKMVLEAVCVLLAEPTEWSSVLSTIGKMDFLDRLKSFNKNDIPKPILRKLKHYLSKPEFTPEIMATKSFAAQSLCMWVIAMSQFSEAYEIVKPKKEKVQAMQAKLEADMQKLRDKEAELQAVQEKVGKLEEECRSTQQRMEQLEADIKLTQERLVRAELLLDLLHDEGIRWEQQLEELNHSMQFLIGDVFLSAASVSYLGPFTGIYRKEMLHTWHGRCLELGVPCTEDYSLATVLSTPLQIQDWGIAGLPSDTVSVENAIMATTSPRWPLMIDPQLQAHGWIKTLEKDNDIKLLKMKSSQDSSKKEGKETLRILQTCIMNGKPLLFEDVGETLDPSIEPIITKQVLKQPDGRLTMRLGEEEVSYDPAFKVYLTTKMPNPHYLPEVCIKVNVINFTVTFPGLEEQLLGDVVKIENLEVEKQKQQLISQMAADNKLLSDIQSRILKLISESKGNILDDTNLIETMQKSKTTSKTIQQRMDDSARIEKNINSVRETYRDIAIRGAILYFSVVELAGIDPMYQYSLVYIKKLFNGTIKSSPPGSSFEERLAILIENITRNIYVNICRGVFETHKMIFSFMIATAIKRKEEIITKTSWDLLLKGSTIVNLRVPSNPDPAFISKFSWEMINALALQVEGFDTLPKSLTTDLQEWKTFAATPNPYLENLPGEWSQQFDAFLKLLIVRALRPDKLLLAFSEYIRITQGSFFTESPSVTMDKIYADSENRTPIIFVLSQGADPTNSLLNFAHDMSWSEKFKILSLGQGQGPKATEELLHAKSRGTWLLLQNCHLAESWMPSLEQLVLDLQEDPSVAPSFRLFLTSMPVTYFPVSVLQNGLKLTTEPPRGIRANLLKSYGEMTEEKLNDCKKPTQWKKLLFGISFFHAVLQERRKFGPLGFNIRYDFNDTDLETSKKFLKKFLEENDDIPWDALLYLTGHINYGGRVTDDLDRLCLLATLRKFCSTDILEDNYSFSESGIYIAPMEGDLNHYISYIESLPQNDLPEIFGLHENANIVFQTQDSEKVLNTILSIQPRDAEISGGKSSDEVIMEFASSVRESLPELIDLRQGFSELFVKVEYDLIPPITTVLVHEIERFNTLLKVMFSSLEDIQKAIRGEIGMSQELDEMYSSLLKFQVPNNWRKVSYPSLKPLNSWIEDLKERVSFMSSWLKMGNPPCYWLSGFFFPQAFITGTLQTHSRRNKMPIDNIRFTFNVLDQDKEDIVTGPFDGVYVYGLFMDGARWDPDERAIADQRPGELYSRVPVIHFLPTDDPEGNPNDYSCPVYKTSVRAGVLSTTGHSTNFILSVDLPSEEPPELWTLKGAAMLCQLND